MTVSRAPRVLAAWSAGTISRVERPPVAREGGRCGAASDRPPWPRPDAHGTRRERRGGAGRDATRRPRKHGPGPRQDWRLSDAQRPCCRTETGLVI